MILASLCLYVISVPNLAVINQERTYEEALSTWASFKDIHSWIEENFKYDMKKALAISDKTNTSKPAILLPGELFLEKKGICVDLSRFAYETLEKIDPQIEKKYLMIEFEPLEMGNSTLRRHWFVLVWLKGKIYAFADSNRPGTIAGPYDDLSTFIGDYETFRGRKVVKYKTTESFRKKRKKRTLANRKN